MAEGREGRKYDKQGIAACMCRKTKYDIERIFDEYIDAEDREDFSEAALEPVAQERMCFRLSRKGMSILTSSSWLSWKRRSMRTV